MDSGHTKVAELPTEVDGVLRVSAKKKSALIRVLLLVLVVGAMYAVAAYFGWLEHITKDNVRAWMTQAGWTGIGLYVLAFVVGNILHLPSNVFLAAAVLSYGFGQGWAIGYSTNVLSVCISFVFVRTLGGRALDAVEKPWVRSALTHLDTKPIRTIALLRTMMAGAPWLNYLLSMSNVRMRDYAIGSAIGLAPHLLVLCLLVDWFIDVL